MDKPLGSRSNPYGPLGLRSNPFSVIPPIHTYEVDLRSLFCVREQEAEQLTRLAARGSATFVTAPYGGGKTVVILEALTRLKGQGQETLYLQFDPTRGFRHSIGAGLSGAGISTGDSDPIIEARRAALSARGGGSRLILAVDDLDRAGDIREVIDVTHDVRDLLSDGAAVILAGQPFGVTHDLYTSAGGIFHQVSLPEFSEDDFQEMLSTYLRAAHVGSPPSATHPFDEHGAGFVCREMATARLTPRLFNFAVSELLERAVSEGVTLLSLDFILRHWSNLSERVVRSLTPLQQWHLRMMLEAGSVSEDSQEAINKLGQSALAEYPHILREVLRPLLEENLLQVRVLEGREEFALTPHAAAAVGDLLRPGDRLAVTHDELTATLRQALGALDRTSKGKLLERFAVMFLASVPGFNIPEDGVDLRTEHEEIDVFVKIQDYRHHLRFGTFTLCECKNWTERVKPDALAWFYAKLQARGCKFGIFIAPCGVTAGFRQQIRGYLREGVVIAVLTGEELVWLESGKSPEDILSDAYYRTVAGH